jgi:hypothetical protein
MLPVCLIQYQIYFVIQQKTAINFYKMKIFVSTFALALAQNDYYEYDYQNITGSDWFPESNPDALSGYDTGNTYPAANAGYDAGYGPPKMTCWTCHSSSYEECEAQGEERECHENEVIKISTSSTNFRVQIKGMLVLIRAVKNFI